MNNTTETSPLPTEAVQAELAAPAPTFPIIIAPPETEAPAEASPEASLPPMEAAPEASPEVTEEIPESPVPDESPLPESAESPAPTEETQELIAVEDEEPVPAQPSLLAMWPGVLGGFVLGAVIAALIARAKAKAKQKKAAVISGAKINGVVVQGQGTREDQQDALFLSDLGQYSKQGILMCVADGMGGLSNGSACSSTAASAAATKFASSDKSDPQKLVASLVQCCSASVNRLLSPNLCSGGSTLLLGYIRDGKFYYASVGDSRISLYRDGQLIHLNRQHVFSDELMLHHVNGELSYESAIMHEKGGALTSYLGMGALKHADICGAPISLRRGDRLLLMSDGVFNTVGDAELAAILGLKPGLIHDRLCDAVESKQKRHQDNYSAVIVTID